MRPSKPPVALITLLLLAAPALAEPSEPAPEVDFSGSWVLDERLSQPMDPIFALQDMSWAVRKAAASFDSKARISQSADRLTVTFDNLLGEQRQELFFDGAPHTTVNPAGVPTTFTSAWADGVRLVASGSLKSEEGQEGTLTEVRTLSEDGQVMTVRVQVTLSGGETASAARAYRRQ